MTVPHVGIAVPIIYTIAGVCMVKPNWGQAAGPFFLAGSVVWLVLVLLGAM